MSTFVNIRVGINVGDITSHFRTTAIVPLNEVKVMYIAKGDECPG